MDYVLSTGNLARIRKYSGLNFNEILDLPYPFYLLLNKESWINSFRGTPEGAEILKTLWRLRQTAPDYKKVREYEER